MVDRIRCIALLGLLGLAATGCAARYKLADNHLDAARDEPGGLTSLHVFVSNRTVTRYRWAEGGPTTPGPVIQQRSDGERATYVLNKRTDGVIVREENNRGANQLWVCFEPSCEDHELYGFVQVNARAYRLNHVPSLAGFGPPKVHRTCVSKRHKMERGKLAALSDTVDVYRLTRKRVGGRTVFLEVRVENDTREGWRRRTHPGAH